MYSSLSTRKKNAYVIIVVNRENPTEMNIIVVNFVFVGNISMTFIRVLCLKNSHRIWSRANEEISTTKLKTTYKK